MNVKNIGLCILLLATANNIMSTKRYLRNKILENPVGKDSAYVRQRNSQATTPARKPSGMPPKSYIQSTLHTANNPIPIVNLLANSKFTPSKTIQPTQNFIRFNNTSPLRINGHLLQAPSSFMVQSQNLQRTPQVHDIFLPPLKKSPYKKPEDISPTEKIKPFKNNTLENSNANINGFSEKLAYQPKFKMAQPHYKNPALLPRKTIYFPKATPLVAE